MPLVEMLHQKVIGYILLLMNKLLLCTVVWVSLLRITFAALVLKLVLLPM
jgi:hypothetical protein